MTSIAAWRWAWIGAEGSDFANANGVPRRVAAEGVIGADCVAAIDVIAARSARGAAIVSGVAAGSRAAAVGDVDVARAAGAGIAANTDLVAIAGNHSSRNL